MDKWGIWAIRSSLSGCGAAEAWVKNVDGERAESTEDEARKVALKLTERCLSMNVSYQARAITCF